MHRYASFDEAIDYLAKNYQKGCLWSILRLDLDAFYVFRSQATPGGLGGVAPADNKASVETEKFGRFSPYYAGNDGPGRHSEELLIENFELCIQHWRKGLSGLIGKSKIEHKPDTFWPPRINIINSHTPCISGVMTNELNKPGQHPSPARTIRGLIYPESCAFKLATLRASAKESLWSLSWFAVHKYGVVDSKAAEQWQESEIKRCLVPLGFSVDRVSEEERAVAKAKSLKL